MLTDKQLCEGYVLDLAGGSFLLDCDPIVQPPQTDVVVFDLTSGEQLRTIKANTLCSLLHGQKYTMSPPVGWEPMDNHQRGVIE